MTALRAAHSDSKGLARSDRQRATAQNRASEKPTLKVVLLNAAGAVIGTFTFYGRFGWTLQKLIEVGERGLTAADLPAGARLAHYIFRLKRDGIPITSDREHHGGAFSGSHARYRLSGRVEIIEGDRA